MGFPLLLSVITCVVKVFPWISATNQFSGWPPVCPPSVSFRPDPFFFFFLYWMGSNELEPWLNWNTLQRWMDTCPPRGIQVTFCQETEERLLFGGMETSPSVGQQLAYWGRDVSTADSWDFSRRAGRWVEKEEVVWIPHYERETRQLNNRHVVYNKTEIEPLCFLHVIVKDRQAGLN